MIPHSTRTCSLVAVSVKTRRTQTFRAFYATIRGLRQPIVDNEDVPVSENVGQRIFSADFFLSILRANPSLRDTRSYIASFGPRPQPQTPSTSSTTLPSPSSIVQVPQRTIPSPEPPKPSPILASILNPVIRRTALVKIQGPFTDVQLDSITRGLVYLEKLGLVSVIVVENDELHRGEQDERSSIIEETMRVVTSLEKHGARARPVVGAIVRLGPKPGVDETVAVGGIFPPESHTTSSDLIPIRSALRAGEIPVISPFALDSFCRSIRIDANDVIAGLARGMVEAAAEDHSKRSKHGDTLEDVDLTPLRLMIINREGGVPSYARNGYPHLLINLESEYSHIHETFHPPWHHSHPTALSNLSLARTCLAYMPPTSSAVMVSHRSPSSLIANLITNKPAVSSSLPHALLQGNRKLTPSTPTLLRRGLPIQVIRNFADIDQKKMNRLLEDSFRRILDQNAFYGRLEKTLDYVILAGDYAGAAIVTKEECPGLDAPITYLDKFAVLPSHQGDGTVDFLWVALHDESYGLGLSFSANPNGGKGGKGEGRDLVWRSRADNPVNKWYFERSTGHLRVGSWVLFWCDAEKRLEIEKGRRGSSGLSHIEDWEDGRLSKWADVIFKIPATWKK
ncbi:Amino-acid acetyltransferase, mitochondrial [Termitomyces sp. Mi166|nr:Amino-acid acetyltransferase, mitochondrial [Termitomyces sp. Mi166\